jgi:DNA-binding SARP family transcriptional activator/WD40 repeat protein
MEGSAGLQFRVLGPFEARLNDRVLPLGGVKQRLVLAALLVQANAVVSVDRLTEVLWGNAPPDDAPRTITKYVYRLRLLFGSATAGILLTRPPGYLLSLQADQLDSAQFAALVSDGQRMLAREPDRALTLLDMALGLWHGPAWAEFADQDFIRPELTRLEGLRAIATEARADAMLTLGRWGELIPDLETVVAEYPMRERPHSQLMLALYLSGRQADALAVFRNFRRYLLDEVGLEPSESMRRLENDILQQKAQLGSQRRPASNGTLWSPSADSVRSEERLIGRREELTWLEVLFARAAPGGHPVVALIGGVAGIGKTCLVRTFGRLAHARGAAVIFAQCDPLLGATGSVLEIIRADTGTPQESSGPDASRRAIGDALDRIEATTLLILDDVDAADRDAPSLVEHLMSRRFGPALCVLATTRNSEDFHLDGTDLPRRVLGGLRRSEVADLLANVSGGARSSDLVDSVCAQTEGVPALIAQVGRRLRDLDIAKQADRALAQAEATKHGLTEIRDEVARGVPARRQLQRESASSAKPYTRRQVSLVCPYKGLAPFGVSDADYFCGRERLVAELVANLAVDRFIAVVGFSGCGKSSLIAAGLLPALADGGLPGSDQWPHIVIRPGRDPIRVLADALAPLIDEPASGVYQHLAADPTAVDDLAQRALQGQGAPGSHLVVVVDQFEEVFTVCTDPAVRHGFINALVESPTIPDSAIVVAIVIRADYYGACAEHSKLAKLLGERQMLVAAMNDADLRRAVLEPARRAGLTVEDGLADAICEDAAGEPGALPLVSTALLETWVRRSHDTLTWAGYAEAGGVRGAVSRLADGVYDGLDAEGKAATRHIFLRLADPQGRTADVRRRARHDEVAGTDVERRVLATLINHRLVTATGDTVEVAHEALLREWPRLRTWLEEDREGRRLHRQLADAAAAWEADNRDDAGLYRGVRLQAAREWAGSHAGDANPIEAEFIAASEAAHERTLRSTRRTARRLRALAIGLAALLVIAVVAGVLLAVQRAETRKQANLARARALQEETIRLATLARTLPDDQRDLALLLGAQDYRIEQSNETAGGLQAALVQTPPGLDRIIRYRSPSLGPHLDRAGRLLAVPGQDGTVTIYDVASGQLVRSMTWSGSREFAAFSADDRYVAAGGRDGQIPIWDATNGQLSGRPLPVGGRASAVFDPTDPRRLYAVTDTGELTTWDRSDPDHPRQVGAARNFAGGEQDGDPSYVTVSPDGRYVAAGDPRGEPLYVLDTRSGKEPPVAHSDENGPAGEFASDGVTVPTVSAYGVQLHNVATGGEVPISIPGGALPIAALSRDGKQLAVIDGSRNVLLYNGPSHQAIGAPLKSHDNLATALAFLPGGQLMIIGSTNAEIWSIDRSLPPIAVALPAPSGPSHPSTTTFLSGTDDIITNGVHGELLRHSPSTGQTLGPLLAGAITSPAVASPEGRLLASVSTQDGAIAIWDRTSGQKLAVLPGLPPQTTGVPASAALAWSPTGDLLAADLGPSIQLWNVSDPSHPRLKSNIPKVLDLGWHYYLLFGRDGHLLVSATADGKRVTVIDVSTHHTKWAFDISDPRLGQVALSPDGKTLAVNSGDPNKGQVALYNTATGKQRQAVSTESFGGVEFLHHGGWLIVTSASSGQEHAQLYDATTLEPIGVTFSYAGTPGGYGRPIAVNNAGTLFSEAEADRPPLWDVNPADWLTIACRIAGRNLTQAEWHQYLPSRPYQLTCPGLPAGR